jgi:hypothetical protein
MMLGCEQEQTFQQLVPDVIARSYMYTDCTCTAPGHYHWNSSTVNCKQRAVTDVEIVERTETARNFESIVRKLSDEISHGCRDCRAKRDGTQFVGPIS